MTPTSAGTIAMMMEEEEAVAKRDDNGGADITNPFYYLAGPMSNLPRFNFPRFNEVADVLREQGYNIVNPANLDHEIARAVKESADGSHKKLSAELEAQGLYAPSWADCLKRDIQYVADDNCKGVIVMEGWEVSQGAQFETYVAYKLRKPIYAFSDGPTLTEIDRREGLTAAGVVD